MNTVNEWYAFGKGSVDKKTCNKLKKLGQNKWSKSTVDTKKGTSEEERKTGREGDYQLDSKVRVSDVAWCSEQWVFDLLFPFMHRANEQAGWRYDIKAAESCQITRYRKGGFYNFHRDGMGDHLSAYHNPQNAFLHGHVRKLSMSVILNDNFEGGAFEFASYGKERCEVNAVEASTGSVIVFPSWMEHRVAPVTKGTRHSVVMWFLGPPFV